MASSTTGEPSGASQVQRYFTQHDAQLQECTKNALHALLKARPAAPLRFLAEFFAGEAASVERLCVAAEHAAPPARASSDACSDTCSDACSDASAESEEYPAAGPAAEMPLMNRLESEEVSERQGDLNRAGTRAPPKSCRFWFVDAAELRRSTDSDLPMHQRLRDQHPGWLKKLPITHEEACACAYAGRLLVVSHRWEDKAAPDRKGVQLEAIRAFLRDDTSGQKFEWVWHELMSRRLRHTPGQAGPEAQGHEHEALLPT